MTCLRAGHLAEKPSHTLYTNRSTCYHNLGRLEEALADAEASIKIKPSWVKGHWRKGQALADLQRFAEARDAYEAALALDNDNEDIAAALADVKVSSRLYLKH